MRETVNAFSHQTGGHEHRAGRRRADAERADRPASPIYGEPMRVALAAAGVKFTNRDRPGVNLTTVM
jgi:hypothetical protein